MNALAQQIKERARRLGFELAGIASAVPADGFEHLQAWLARGFAGDMHYLQRYADAHQHPDKLLPGVRSVVMVAMNYRPQKRGTGFLARPGESFHEEAGLPRGKVAKYALGADYHTVLREKLGHLLSWIQEQVPGTKGRAVVDTAPLLERDFARRAGLGWFGKNTMLINKKLGSWCFLAALLLDLDLPADEPFSAQHCGTCTACLDACPTDALVAPYVLDSRRCISYLTIELRGSVPEELRADMGDWIFGCDVCQDVCPWNRKAPAAVEPAFAPHPDLEAVDLIAMLAITEEEFRRRFRHTPLWRARRRGLARNVAIALGNLGDGRALPALRQALEDPEPLVREAAEWAIARLTRLSVSPP